MRKIITAVLFLSLAGYALGADYNLTAPKDLIPSQAESYSFRQIYGDADSKRVQLYYYWKDANGDVIRPYGNARDGKQIFECTDQDSVPDVRNLDCVALDDPHDCCTGLGTGTCDDRFLNADCTADGAPFDCCTDLDEGTCECWNDIKSTLQTLGGLLKTELDKEQGITTE